MRVTEPAQVGRVVAAATRSRDDVIDVGAGPAASTRIAAHWIPSEDRLAQGTPRRAIAALRRIAPAPLIAAPAARAEATTVREAWAARGSADGRYATGHLTVLR